MSRNSEYLTILSLLHESSKSLEIDLIASYLTLNAALRRTQPLSTRVTGHCDAWALHLRQKRLWYLANVPLTTKELALHSGKSYHELSLLLTTENLTLQD